MRVHRLIRFAALLCAVAAALAGCAGGRAFGPGAAPGEAVYRDFRWPVEGRIAAGYGGRGGRLHRGLDILAPEGTPVLAAEAGVVVYAGNRLRGYGNAAVLDHGGGATTLYGHLREIHVKSGDVVAAGTVIGAVGRTGNATTSHLHFELRMDGKYVDPSKYLEKAE